MNVAELKATSDDFNLERECSAAECRDAWNGIGYLIGRDGRRCGRAVRCERTGLVGTAARQGIAKRQAGNGIEPDVGHGNRIR